ncbi:hypothetical protein [Methanolobus bombayensis]|nr:hypothetical protein [Methanolobus bombayensis]MBP1909970.1 hypothetical protein [Methanolobus bombayensis]
MEKCDICKKKTEKLIPLNGKKVCKECFEDNTSEDLDTESLDFGACI